MRLNREVIHKYIRDKSHLEARQAQLTSAYAQVSYMRIHMYKLTSYVYVLLVVYVQQQQQNMQYAYQYYLALQSQYQAAPFQAIPYTPHTYSTTGTNTTTNTVYMTPATAVMSHGQDAQQQQYMYQAVPGMMPGAVQYQQPYPIVYATPQAMLPSATDMAGTTVTGTEPIRDTANTRTTPALAPGLLSSVVYPIQPVAVVLPVSAPRSTLALVEAEEVKEEPGESPPTQGSIAAGTCGDNPLNEHMSQSAFDIPGKRRTTANNTQHTNNNNDKTHGTTTGPLAAPITTTTRAKYRRHKKHNKVPSVIVTPSHSSSGAGHVTTDLNAPNEPNLSSSSTTTDSSLPSHSHGPVTTNTNAAMPTTEYRTHSSPLPTIPHTSTTTGGAAAHPDSSSSGAINLL